MTTSQAVFALPSADKAVLEEGNAFTPKFDADGLVTAVVTDSRDGMLLMVAHMNAQALALTIRTGIAHYWSRSRKALWKKGETSGNLQRVQSMRTDCDQDAVWLSVIVDGHDATCHTGRRSCFYREITSENDGFALKSVDETPKFDPKTVYQRG